MFAVVFFFTVVVTLSLSLLVVVVTLEVKQLAQEAALLVSTNAAVARAFYCSALFLLVLYVGLPKRVLQQPPGEDHESQERMLACIDIEDRSVLESAQDFGTVMVIFACAIAIVHCRIKQAYAPQARADCALLTGSRHVEGVALITSAALLFGILAAVVKSVALPTLLKMQIRSLLEWLICLAAAAFCRETRRRGGDTGAAMRVYDNSGAEARPSTFAKCGGGEGGEREAWAKLLFGPRELSGWLVLRAFLYWVFLCCWWLALEAMPLGDATTVVYIAPVFTALFARLFLAERTGA
ncbi:hypothetical protein EMIHUDRAFT_113428 [Emiliania huxleyi CCMP1516]|uniref:EamA domain-containing protein n=2 Tax=Emiliania huxleyi TaxID=2903 RepID=A0A0D3K373_EMIH1|nr:hypothetical protein EMIHUDRAFT_113428 [Emiliania huxleyi CCMP1516]EOD30208.1 hypothetical protein EMIHUDRAFT_113428 [Emiliania huxleyi CCMP1516]|eukprot:XP_005782637.1 hypothetical protein EMIHUDRAFT_113428 [Emiliania huxleyi CCMP1516]